MNIIVVLMKKDLDLRVTNGDKWLIWNGDEWEVMQKKYGRKTTQSLITTQFQDEAIEVLITDN